MRYLDGPRPRFFAHRGGALEGPENTLEAFASGLAAGADRLELDVHATADGEVVVLHDASLERTTDGIGFVRAHTLARVKELDAAYHFTGAGGDFPLRGRAVRVPTLAEVLETFPGVPLNIEIKQLEPPIVDRVLAVLDRYDARAQVLLAAEDARIMQQIRAAAPDVVTSFSTEDVVEFLTAWQEGQLDRYRPPGIALQIPPTFGDLRLVDAESVGVAHGLGLEVHVWTIDAEAEIESLLALGVDGIMTDRPHRAARVLRPAR